MAILKFQSLEELDKFEREGKGINWNFTPDEAYFRKVLNFRIKVPFPPGVYKFKTFKEAQAWESNWWIKSGFSPGIG